MVIGMYRHILKAHTLDHIRRQRNCNLSTKGKCKSVGGHKRRSNRVMGLRGSVAVDIDR